MQTLVYWPRVKYIDSRICILANLSFMNIFDDSIIDEQNYPQKQYLANLKK